MKSRERIINNYIEAYNDFNVRKMVRDLAPDIVFENISNGEATMTLQGIEEFIEQAENATEYFSARNQTLKSVTHADDRSIVEVNYTATLAVDLPDGPKKGDELRIQGKSIFQFSGDKIVKLTDIG